VSEPDFERYALKLAAHLLDVMAADGGLPVPSLEATCEHLHRLTGAHLEEFARRLREAPGGC
jgi:hypothetical protein